MDPSFRSIAGSILGSRGIRLWGVAPLPSRFEIEALLTPAYLDSLPSSLSYLKKEAWRDPSSYLPWARSVICCALPYNTSGEFSRNHISRGRCWISRYAWGEDYHGIFREKLMPLKAYIEENGFRARIAVDSFPLLERSLAVKAGLGFIGRNGLLIVPGAGSYVFLGGIATDAPLTGGGAGPALSCGECSLCVSACPSRALRGDGSIEPSLCVSSYNVEWKGDLPRETPPLLGRLFGCDICQEVCPFNRVAPLSGEKAFDPREGLFAPVPGHLAAVPEALARAIKGTPLERRGVSGIVRNALKILDEEG